jgi:hypothetical protein
MLKLIGASESVIMAQLQLWQIVLDWNSGGVFNLDVWTLFSALSSLASVGYAASTFRFQLATNRTSIKTRTTLVVAAFSALSTIEIVLRLTSISTWVGSRMYWWVGFAAVFGGAYASQLAVYTYLLRVRLNLDPQGDNLQTAALVFMCMMFGLFAAMFSSVFFTMIPIAECSLAVQLACAEKFFDNPFEQYRKSFGQLTAIYTHFNNLILPVGVALASRLLPDTSLSPGRIGAGVLLVVLYALCELILHGGTPLSTVPLLKYTYETPWRVIQSPEPAEFLVVIQAYSAGVRLRRFWRALCAVCTFMLFSTTAYVLPTVFTLNRDVSLSLSNDMVFSLTSCDLTFVSGPPTETIATRLLKVLFEQDMSDQIRLPFVRVKMGRHDGSQLRTPGQNMIVATRGSSSAFRCELFVHFDPATTLPATTVQIASRGAAAAQSCSVSEHENTTNQSCSAHDGIRRDFRTLEDPVHVASIAETVNMTSLRIAGDMGLIELPGLSATAVDVELLAGQLVFRDILFATTANLSVVYGDALVSSQRMGHLRVDGSKTLASCLAAPQLETANRSSTSGNASAMVAWLCSTETGCGFHSAPVLSSRVDQGLLSVSLLGRNESRRYQSAQWQLPKSMAMLPDVRSPFLLAGASEWVQEDPGSDSIIRIELTGLGQEVGRWLYSTNRAFRFIPVWLVKVLSLGVVAPRDVHLFARVLPSSCPDQAWGMDDTQTLGAVAGLLRSTLGVDKDQGVLLLQPYDETERVEFDRRALGSSYRAEIRSLGRSPLTIAVVAVGFVAAFVFICAVVQLLVFVSLFMIQGQHDGWPTDGGALSFVN